VLNDALPQDWDKKVSAEPRFGLTQGKLADPGFQKRYDTYVNRFSAAMAKSAQGEVIIVTQTRTSRNGGDGAYSKPDPQTPAENRWRLYEFPLAQRNKKVTSVVSYALQEKPLKKVVDFQPGGAKGELLPVPSFPNPRSQIPLSSLPRLLVLLLVLHSLSPLPPASQSLSPAPPNLLLHHPGLLRHPPRSPSRSLRARRTGRGAQRY
jgi:hypothetical protein